MPAACFACFIVCRSFDPPTFDPAFAGGGGGGPFEAAAGGGGGGGGLGLSAVDEDEDDEDDEALAAGRGGSASSSTSLNTELPALHLGHALLLAFPLLQESHRVVGQEVAHHVALRGVELEVHSGARAGARGGRRVQPADRALEGEGVELEVEHLLQLEAPAEDVFDVQGPEDLALLLVEEADSLVVDADIGDLEER